MLKKSPPKIVQAETAERPNSYDTERLIKQNINLVAMKALDTVMRNKKTFRNYLTQVGYLPPQPNEHHVDFPVIKDAGK